MEKYTSDLLTNMHYELQQVAMGADNSLQRYERSYSIASEKIRQLRVFMQSYAFRDTEEEIRYFKEIKPQFHKEALYFVELFDIESVRPVATDEARRKHYEKILDRIMDFFDRNREFYNYYRTAKTHMDDIYFVRKEIDVLLPSQYAFDLDATLSTPYSSILSQLQAYEQICSHINNALYNKPAEQGEEASHPKGATWSATKASLIELAVALYYSGSVNFGKGGFKKFIAQLESFFNINLGNVYRAFLGMVIRKKDPTPFLHELQATFVRKLEERSI